MMLKDKLAELENKHHIGTPWRHVKTGTVYVISGYVYIENGTIPAVCYYQQGIEDQVTWVRPASKFFDGRFKRVR